MTFSERLMALRRSKGWSQEQLGEMLGVTRQMVSKWELGSTTPEMEKLSALGELFGVSLDELVNGKVQLSKKDNINHEKETQGFHYEYKSAKTVCGLPLVHINIGAPSTLSVSRGTRGALKRQRTARGIIAIGNVAIGVLALGAVSFGVFALGLVGVGIAALGICALGIVSGGGTAIGVIAGGGISVGWLAAGGIASGKYVFGGLASGTIAAGDTAQGIVAIGKEVSGEVEITSAISAQTLREILEQRLPNTPSAIVELFVRAAERLSKVN